MLCVLEEQDSSTTVEQSADTSLLSSTTLPTLKVWFQFYVRFTIIIIMKLHTEYKCKEKIFSYAIKKQNWADSGVPVNQQKYKMKNQLKW